MCLLKILKMLPLAEPMAVPQRATENPANLNQGDASSQHHHTASSPHIQLSPGDSIDGILCPNTFTLPGYTHILNSNNHAFDLHTRLYMNTLNPITISRARTLCHIPAAEKPARTQRSPVDEQQHLKRAEAYSTARATELRCSPKRPK